MIPGILNSILLGCLSWHDLRTRKIPGLLCMLYGAAGISMHFFQTERKLPFFAAACFVGTVFALLAFLLRKEIGAGDFLAVWACAQMDSIGNMARILFLALILGGVYAAGMLLLRKAGRKDTIPFVPFLFLGQVIWVVYGLFPHL